MEAGSPRGSDPKTEPGGSQQSNNLTLGVMLTLSVQTSQVRGTLGHTQKSPKVLVDIFLSYHRLGLNGRVSI